MAHEHHDMGSMTMTMSSAMPAMTTAASSMAGMDHGGGGSMNACKISMLWNWYTVDSCFLSRSWHNTSKGMFAGSCIGVILLVMILEFLRRAAKEYDRHLIAQYKKNSLLDSSNTRRSRSPSSTVKDTAVPGAASGVCAPGLAVPARFRPNVFQQAIRALLHMLQFAVAYFVMLLAMYYNGYIIICIFIGAYLGYFVFGWQSLSVGGGNGRLEEEVTVCCG